MIAWIRNVDVSYWFIITGGIGLAALLWISGKSVGESHSRPAIHCREEAAMISRLTQDSWKCDETAHIEYAVAAVNNEQGSLVICRCPPPAGAEPVAPDAGLSR